MKKYDMAMEVSPDSIPGKIVSHIQPGMNVLEFGCSYGRMTKYISEALHCHVSIVELDQEAYPVARSYAEDGFCGDIDQEGWYLHFSGRQFDRIMFADVLEHLRDPLKAIERAKSLLKEDGEILVSIPNIGHNDILVKLFQNRFEYTSIGLLDNTHIHFWGEKNLEAFVQQAGCGIRILDGVYLPPYETEQKPDKTAVPSELLNVMANREYNGVYQFFLVLQKQEWMEQQGIACDNRLKKFQNDLVICCFWDLGEGYQSDLHIQIIPQRMPDGKFCIHCDSIPKGCRKVRFDPPLGYHCLVGDIQVSTNIAPCEIYPLNGVCINGVSAFSSTNAQMEFALPEGSLWFDISAQIEIFSASEYNRIFSILQQFAETKAKEHKQSEEIARLQQQAQALTGQLQETTLQNQALEDQIQEMSSHALSLEDQIQELNAQQKIFRTHAQWRDDRIMALEQDTGNHLHRVAELESHSTGLQAHADGLQAKLDQLTAQYNAMINSQCWKITKPLRVVMSAMKRNRLCVLPYKVLRTLRTVGVGGTARMISQRLHAAPTQVQLPASESVQPEPVSESPKVLSALAEEVVRQGGQVFNQDRILASDTFAKKKVLLVSHELNLTGAAVTLNYFAQFIAHQGYFPVVMVPQTGALCDQMRQEAFLILVYDQVYQSDLVSRYADLFDLIVVCTTAGASLVAQLNGAHIPVLWWIHEAHASYSDRELSAMPETLEDNVHVYCGGTYAQQVLAQYRPSYQAKQLLYFVPDYANKLPTAPSFPLEYAEGKIIFAVVGMQEQRKGQDILFRAIRSMDPKLQKQCLFVIAGRQFHPSIFQEILSITEDYPRNVLYIEDLGREDLTSLYRQMDCLICSSRDDPMPTAVTEAMLMSKVIICSENTGSADMLTQMDAGLVYHDNDPEALAQCIAYVCAHHRDDDLLPLRQHARQAYEHYFSQTAFDASVSEIMQQLIRPSAPPRLYQGTVSVIIPTYNAGEEIVALIQTLQQQQNIGHVEIIVVDSESKDGTADRAEQLGAKVIRILQSEFSHSYARNLGAQNATGEYLLFMTQDAMPNGTLWLCGLMQPVLNNGVVAVSCREAPRPDCDLLGKIAIWFHENYMGILEQDRIMRLPPEQDFNSIRRNAQLTDIACLIQRKLFLEFLYRGNYAEDLDLGVRLIRAGYSLALLSSVQVIHSHNRSALYNLKRSLVDGKTLHPILPDMPMEIIKPQVLANRVVTTYCALVLYIKQIKAQLDETTWEAFCQWSNGVFEEIDTKLAQMSRDEFLFILKTEGKQVDQDISSFAQTLFGDYWDGFTPDNSSSAGWRHFLLHVTSQYFSAHNIRFNLKVREEIVEMLPKYTAQIFGSLLAAYSINPTTEDTVMSKIVEQYSRGV